MAGLGAFPPAVAGTHFAASATHLQHFGVGMVRLRAAHEKRAGNMRPKVQYAIHAAVLSTQKMGWRSATTASHTSPHFLPAGAGLPPLGTGPATVSYAAATLVAATAETSMREAMLPPLTLCIASCASMGEAPFLTNQKTMSADSRDRIQIHEVVRVHFSPANRPKGRQRVPQAQATCRSRMYWRKDQRARRRQEMEALRKMEGIFMKSERRVSRTIRATKAILVNISNHVGFGGRSVARTWL
mmetsp:Transcript_35952/g.91903  ORF Transcript_35952/g.91903 Transcript_35952/m.91903 type:complete len:243 (+) Transcript_35952:84-812(+)